MSIIDRGLYDAIKGTARQTKTERDFSTRSGIPSLDRALGGAFPAGAVELYGEPSVGKTSLLYQIIAEAQSVGMPVALCPTEYLDIPYLRTLGVDLNSLVLLTGNTGEWVLEGAKEFLQSSPFSLVAVDSATSLRPKVDEFGSWTSMLDGFLEDALADLSRGSCIIMTNQSRTRRSIHPDRFFVSGDIDSTAKHVIDKFSVRLELGRADVTESGFVLQANLVASVFSMPGCIVNLPFVKGSGVDQLADLVTVALQMGLLEQMGTWVYFGDLNMGQGIVNAAEHLRDYPYVRGKLLDLVYK